MRKGKINTGSALLAISLIIVVAALIGEGMCIYKAINCNWKPVGKAEIIYTVSSFSGFGCIVGYIDIEDE
jgi:cytochrome b subunit of formate dehydrogenase